MSPAALGHLVMPMKIGIHVFARAIHALRRTKKDVDAGRHLLRSLAQHDGVIAKPSGLPA
jgi:hypothetical protein